MLYWSSKLSLGLQLHLAEFASRAHQKWLRPKSELRIAFVIPWYGDGIGGGAEAQCRGLVHGIKALYPDVKVEVITTCLKEFAADWNHNVHAEGEHLESGVIVRRFHATVENRNDFHRVNLYRLMPHLTEDLWRGDKAISPLTADEEQAYIKNMIRSPNMVRYLSKHKYRYDFFLFMPYMFGTTYFGGNAVAGRAVMIPCLHDERYAFMDIYRQVMLDARGVMFNAPAEQRLFQRLYKGDVQKQCVTGETVETDVALADAAAFRKKFAINDPFFLYAGRLVEGKNVPLLVDYFTKYKTGKGPGDKTKLVLIGRGDLSYGREQYPDVVQLGFVSAEDKAAAYRAAEALIQPSVNESFSIVMMESWLQETPVIAHGHCEVTADHCQISKGGATFVDQQTFNAALDKMLASKTVRNEMGKLGRRYVLMNFTQKTVIDRVVGFLKQLRQRF